MNIITVKNKEMLEELRNDSSLTIEGLAEESIKEFLNWIKRYTELKKEDVYITKGNIMNLAYNLSGDNAYSDDINIVSVMLSDMENPVKVAMPRFEIGGRWMDDIIDNNLRREMCMEGNYE